MEFTAEWKSLWPISSTFAAPLLIPNDIPEASLGPLTFIPKPNSSTTLLLCPSISPSLPPLYPQLPLSRFLQNYDSFPSSDASLSSLLGPQFPNYYSSGYHGFNSLQLLQIPDKNLIVAFFPAGENSDRVGFYLISVKDGNLSGHSRRENFVQLVKEGNENRQRIKCLMISPSEGLCDDENGDGTFVDDLRRVSKPKSAAVRVVGFLMVCTDYSVSWYRIGITNVHGQSGCSVCVDYLGCCNAKMLRGSAVVSACWSPHFNEECIVLLENGNLLLFDVSCFGKKERSLSLVHKFVGKKMQVSLPDKLGLVKESVENGVQWFGCEFSWHPRIFIVANRNGVFLIDLRSAGECKVCSLLKFEMLSKEKNDGFFALSRVGSDGFSFTVATRTLLLLCDVRKPLMPVLRWAHTVKNPRFMAVFRLSDLRANAENTAYNLATESGYCIMLGSFWDNELSLFCYGPDMDGNISAMSEISKLCNMYFAWGLPSELSLSGYDCNCGSCLVRGESLKASYPVWIDWRQKKHLILGFGILQPDLSAQLTSLDHSCGGFVLIRLKSSGNLEAQHYVAKWKSENFSEASHQRQGINSGDNLLYDCTHSEYDGQKKFQHLKLEILKAYMKGELAKCIAKRRENRKENGEGMQQKLLVKSRSHCIFHQELCLRMKSYGPSRTRSSLAISDFLRDIYLPISIREIASKNTYAVLPTLLLQLAFSTYSDLDEDPENCKEPLEFLSVPEQLQLPPFIFRKPYDRSNKWSSSVHRSDALVGPILPPQFLTTLHKLWMEEVKAERELYLEESEAFSAHSQFKLLCDKVMETVQEHVSSPDAESQVEDFVSLADDTEDTSFATQKLKLSYHEPYTSSSVDLGKPEWEACTFSTHVYRRNLDLASDLSAEMVQLRFEDSTSNFGPKELEEFKKLMKRNSDFQLSYKPYQDCIRKDRS